MKRGGTHSEADSVKQVLVVRDVRVLLGDSSARGQEHAVRHLPGQASATNTRMVVPTCPRNIHDGGLVHGSDLVSASLGGVVESVTGDSLGCLVRDELDGLDDTVDQLHLLARVSALPLHSRHG